MNKSTGKLLGIYERTYRNCLFYREEENWPALLNEIGCLRGISYCIEEMEGEENLFRCVDYTDLMEMIKEQQSLKEQLKGGENHDV